MPVLSEEATAGLWVQAGGPINQAAMAVAVATEESGRDTDAVNPQSGATGTWQIHPGGPQYKNPQTNASAAVSKWKARGWQPWSVCGSGAWSAGTPNCPKLAAKANAVARRIGAPRVGVTTANVSFTDTAKKWLKAAEKLSPVTAGASQAGDILSTAGDVAGAAGTAFKGIEAVAKAIQDLFNLLRSILEKVLDPNTWADALKIFVGVVLLYMGAKRTFELTK